MVNTSKWLVGYIGTFIILSAMADILNTAELASALAISIAIAATFVFGPKARDSILGGVA